MRKLALALLVSSLSLAAAEPEANWPQWRGPHLNGSSSTARDLPVSWSPTENVVWRLKLPSWSAATPIIWDDTVFVTSAEEGFNEPKRYLPGGGRGKPAPGGKQARRKAGPPQALSGKKDKIFLLAINRADGSIRWRKQIGDGNRIYRKQNLSSPSPATDGKRVWAMTGGGSLVCFDFAGKELWRRDVQADYGTFGLNHGYASTPLLYKNRLYVQVLHGMKTDEPSYVFAVDKMSGKTVWKVERPTDAVAESPDDYSTPVLATAAGKQYLVVSGGDYVTGHDLDSGEELWRMGGLNPNHKRAYRTIASSIVIHDVVYTTSTRGKPFLAFHAGGEGDVSATNLVWKNNLGSDVPTPTTDGRRIYVVNDRGIVVALDAADGKVIWDRRRIEPGIYSSSPLLADGKLYAVSEDGTTTVLRAGGAFEVLGVNKLDSHTLASPSAAGNQLFIRTADYLYCLAKK